jgi:hypothetical protein
MLDSIHSQSSVNFKSITVFSFKAEAQVPLFSQLHFNFNFRIVLDRVLQVSVLSYSNIF